MELHTYCHLDLRIRRAGVPADTMRTGATCPDNVHGNLHSRTEADDVHHITSARRALHGYILKLAFLCVYINSPRFFTIGTYHVGVGNVASIDLDVATVTRVVSLVALGFRTTCRAQELLVLDG